MMGKDDSSKKVSINSAKKAKIGGRGTGRGRGIKWDIQESRSYSNLLYMIYMDGGW
jgi:hypothetical protein